MKDEIKEDEKKLHWSSKTSIVAVSNDNKNKLLKLKIDLNSSSINEVINKLLSKYYNGQGNN